MGAVQENGPGEANTREGGRTPRFSAWLLSH